MDWTAVGVLIAGSVAVAGGMWRLFCRLEGRFERLVERVDDRFDRLPNGGHRFERLAEGVDARFRPEHVEPAVVRRGLDDRFAGDARFERTTAVRRPPSTRRPVAEQGGHFDKALDRLAGETARGFAAVNTGSTTSGPT